LTRYGVVHIFTHMTLREARLAKGLTQVQLAEAVGTTQETISGLETGRIQRPAWEIVGRVARALDVAPQDLFPIDDAAAVEARAE
jgi:transcriptional regulator with XRE-family HTH domain